MRRRSRVHRAAAAAVLSLLVLPARTTGRVVIASATCVAQERFAGFPAKGLMDIQAIVVPGVGVAAAQAGVDNTRQNQNLIYREMRAGTEPSLILEMLKEDPRIERRQFGIVDLQGRCSGFSGADNGAASLSVQDSVPGTGIVFSIQGNILASDQVVHDAVSAFQHLLHRTGAGRALRVPDLLRGLPAGGGSRRSVGRCLQRRRLSPLSERHRPEPPSR